MVVKFFIFLAVITFVEEEQTVNLAMNKQTVS